MAIHFSNDGLKFLRGLARHNDREWFNARKAVYEAELKTPLLALIGEVNEGLAGFAPEFVRAPQKTIMRIYRDIRFSPNKAPYKTHVAAWWAREGMAKTSGAGFYFSFGPEGVIVAAGAYQPEKEQLLAIRRHLAEHHEEYRALVGAKKLKVLFDEFEGPGLSRPPKGFADAPAEAMELIKMQRWGVGKTLAVEAGLETGLVKEIVGRFKVAAPLVALLNAPLTGKRPKPLF